MAVAFVDFLHYISALRELVREPLVNVYDPSDSYHARLHGVYLGDRRIPIRGFAESDHAFFILR